VLNVSLLERVLAWNVNSRGEANMLEARRTFEAATGPMVEGALDYEQRMSHFWEQQLCSGDHSAIAHFAAAHTELSDEERRELAGWRSSHRSLFAFEGFRAHYARLRDCVLGGVYRFSPGDHDQKLAPGDRFDGRLLALGPHLCLSPGRVYHPAEAHGALDTLLARIDIDALTHDELLDALLLMRSRFLQFESVRAEHVYNERALAPVRLRMRADSP
jgi:hypothetical protein